MFTAMMALDIINSTLLEGERAIKREEAAERARAERYNSGGGGFSSGGGGGGSFGGGGGRRWLSLMQKKVR